MDSGRGNASSRTALLELRRERELVEQGHHFLDEKRMQLAREMLLRIEALEKALDVLATRRRMMIETFSEALLRYGYADLLLAPVASALADISLQESVLLGLRLPAAELELARGEPQREPVTDRPPADEAGAASADYLREAARVAAMLTSLQRLDAEYTRTERSVRALENVVLPEIRADEKRTAEAIEEIELEEAVRVRLFSG